MTPDQADVVIARLRGNWPRQFAAGSDTERLFADLLRRLDAGAAIATADELVQSTEDPPRWLGFKTRYDVRAHTGRADLAREEHFALSDRDRAAGRLWLDALKEDYGGLTIGNGPVRGRRPHAERLAEITSVLDEMWPEARR